MPFGISSAPEHFQCRMNKVLLGLPGVLCLIDDILVYGSSKEEHNEILQAVPNRLKSAGVTLNQSKCEFGKETIKFLGHVINSNGVSADPQKIEAIVKIKAPSSLSELRCFLGMTNQLGKFSSNIAEMTKPLTKQAAWLWVALYQSHCNKRHCTKVTATRGIKKNHQGHQGIEKCRLRVSTSVWWPSV